MDILNFLLHIDQYMNTFFMNYGILFYFIVFLIIFCETGLVITPFLPGDSLLFALGSLAAISNLNVIAILAVVAGAAIVGDSVNYSIGKYIGPKIFSSKKSRFFNVENLNRAREFNDKYGGKALILSRFMPVLRTFVPFVSGATSMHFSKFVFFNVIGGLLWTFSLVFAGYFFGNIPIIKANFEYVVLGIVFVSMLPMIIGLIKKPKNIQA